MSIWNNLLDCNLQNGLGEIKPRVVGLTHSSEEVSVMLAIAEELRVRQELEEPCEVRVSSTVL